MAFQIAVASKTAMLNTLVTSAGSTSSLVIYNGTAPATPDTALSGNSVLATCTCAATMGVVSTNVLTLNTLTGVNAVLTGTATFYRLLASNGTTVLWQGSVGVSASELNLITTTITAGGPVNITSLTVTL